MVRQPYIGRVSKPLPRIEALGCITPIGHKDAIQALKALLQDKDTRQAQLSLKYNLSMLPVNHEDVWRAATCVLDRITLQD